MGMAVDAEEEAGKTAVGLGLPQKGGGGLAVPDAEKTAAFFSTALGFSASPVSDPGWRFVGKYSCLVMLGLCLRLRLAGRPDA